MLALIFLVLYFAPYAGYIVLAGKNWPIAAVLFVFQFVMLIAGYKGSKA